MSLTKTIINSLLPIVTRQAVSKWENGTANPSTSNLLALAKLYGVSVEELLSQVKSENTAD
jgi:transcriptional regulator with XRE-family HTH domain